MTDHEQWLNSVEVGCRVAVKDRPIDTFMSYNLGWRIYVVKYITPKRTRFDLTGQDNKDFTLTTKNTCSMRPVTPEILESIQLDNSRIRATNKAERLVKTLRAAIDNTPDRLDESGIYESMIQLLKFLPSVKE